MFRWRKNFGVSYVNVETTKLSTHFNTIERVTRIVMEIYFQICVKQTKKVITEYS